MKRTHRGGRNRFVAGTALAVCALMALRTGDALADKAGDKRRTLLASVRRLVIVSPFVGLEAATKPEKQNGKGEAAKAQMLTGKDGTEALPYADALRQLEETAGTHLPVRVAARTPYRIVPSAEVEEALKSLKLTPQQLFQENGRMRGTRFALPDAAPVRRLAAQLRADAVILVTLAEPRRNGERFIITPFSFYNRSAFVTIKGGYFVLMADGTEAYHAYMETLRPMTPTGKPSHLLADWKDATRQMCEDFLDELTRYTPAPEATK